MTGEPTPTTSPTLLMPEASTTFVISSTTVRSILVLTPELKIYSERPLPNRFRRFWYKLLLGWEWRSA